MNGEKLEEAKIERDRDEEREKEQEMAWWKSRLIYP